jgi:hypothetical protein
MSVTTISGEKDMVGKVRLDLRIESVGWKCCCDAAPREIEAEMRASVMR